MPSQVSTNQPKLALDNNDAWSYKDDNGNWTALAADNELDVSMTKTRGGLTINNRSGAKVILTVSGSVNPSGDATLPDRGSNSWNIADTGSYDVYVAGPSGGSIPEVTLKLSQSSS